MKSRYGLQGKIPLWVSKWKGKSNKLIFMLPEVFKQFFFKIENSDQLFMEGNSLRYWQENFKTFSVCSSFN